MVTIKDIQTIAQGIYNELGSGFDECIYQKAIEVELRLAGIPYENQRIIPIFYKNHNIGESKADLIIDNSIVVEIKAISTSLSDKEESQLRKYMECTGLSTGLLVNFPQAGRKGCAVEPEFISVP